jgi:hypothetical protein
MCATVKHILVFKMWLYKDKFQVITTIYFDLLIILFFLLICTNQWKCRYKLSFYATDGTAEAKMFCFDTIARQIVGKPCEILIRSINVSTSTPIELSSIIGLRFTSL